MNKQLQRLNQRIIQIKSNKPIRFRYIIKINANKFTNNPEFD